MSCPTCGDALEWEPEGVTDGSGPEGLNVWWAECCGEGFELEPAGPASIWPKDDPRPEQGDLFLAALQEAT